MTYTDSKLGFSIDFPEEVYTAKIKKDKGILLWLKGNDDIYEASILVLSKKEEELTLDNSARAEEIQINGKRAKKRNFENSVWGKYVEIRIRIENKIVQMLLITNSDNEALGRFEKIVDSFRILN